MNTCTGADLTCRALVEEGASVLFGHPGGAILPFYDSLYGFAGLRHVLCRHEQGAAHAADGYARATGRTGVCVATSGPGATNLVTGLATALMDSVPLVALTGQVARPTLGTMAFQETDTLGVTMPVTKHGFLVESASDLPRVIAEAFRIAASGRPGPVLIDLPKDVQAELVCDAHTEDINRIHEAGLGEAGHARPDLDEGVLSAITTAARWLTESERPVLLVGRGAVLSGSARAVADLAKRADLPVATSLLGLDVFPAKDPRSLGMPGMHGNERANLALQRADLILGLGVRFDDRIVGPVDRFAPAAKVVHFEIDPCAIGRTLAPDLAVVADLAASLPVLVRQSSEMKRPAYWQQLRQWERAADPTPAAISSCGPLGAREAVRAVARRISQTGGLAVSDVGQHQMWLAQELEDMVPGTHLSSGGLGTMGYALPAAIGAAIGRPDRPVWAVAGDGGFQMTVQELATVVQEQLPLRIVVMDNGHLGMVRQWQERFYDKRYSAVKISGPDIVALGRAYGLPAWRVSRSDQLEPALEEFSTTAGPVLLCLEVQEEENVYPLVPPGATLDEMVMKPVEAAR